MVDGCLGRLNGLADDLGRTVAELDCDTISGEDASLLVEAFERFVRLGEAGRMMAAQRAASCSGWKHGGRYESPGQWLAQATGQGLKQAERLLEQAKSLQDLPRVEEALRSGRLSGAQAEVVTAAATVDPEAQGELLDAAASGLKTLRAVARQVKNRARSAETDQARRERQHEARRCHLATDDEGMGTIYAKLPPEKLGAMRQAIEAETERLFALARDEGRKEPLAAYRADALFNLVTGAQGGRAGRNRLLIRVDADAIQRGCVEGEGVCDIPGVGPVPVDAARDLLGDSLLAIVITKGTEIVGIANPGRRAKVALELALMWRFPQCVVPGCGATSGLEIDHFPIHFGRGGETKLDNLVRICRRHHRMRHREGYVLSSRNGQWRWDPPPAPFPGPGIRPGSRAGAGSGADSDGGSGAGAGSGAGGGPPLAKDEHHEQKADPDPSARSVNLLLPPGVLPRRVAPSDSSRPPSSSCGHPQLFE